MDRVELEIVEVFDDWSNSGSSGITVFEVIVVAALDGNSDTDKTGDTGRRFRRKLGRVQYPKQ